MASDGPWQVLSDCPHCLTEAAVLEWMDPHHPACHLGVPAERRCRMCGWTERARDEAFAARHRMALGRCPACTRPLGEAARTGQGPCPHCDYRPVLEPHVKPADLRPADVARRALARWATEEGADDVEGFCQANMGASAAEVVRLLGANEPVPTTFDVIAFLFPGQGGAAGAQDAPVVVDRPPAPQPDPAATAPPAAHTMDPRTPGRVLVSVMVADGALRGGERDFVQRWLSREGLPAMTPDDLRVWRPAELGVAPPPDLRDRLLEAAIHLMHLDRERDGSEWRVIQAFARAWRVSDAQLTAWDRRYDRRYGNPMSALFRALDRLVRP